MANELTGAYKTGLTVYAHLRSPAKKIWNGTAFETYAAANYATYDIALTEQGGSGIYIGDFPSAVTTAGTYEYTVYRQSGSSPAEGDPIINTGKIDWTGSVVFTVSSAAMSGSDFRDYILRLGFKRTDKDTELYEAVTDAIQELRRRFSFDEAETDQTTTDTISVLGDFKLALETDLGLLNKVVVQDGTDATELNRLGSASFFSKYPDLNVTADRGYPKDFCIFAGSIYVAPIPDSVSYTYRIMYSKRAGTITALTAGVPFTDLYRDVLAYAVLSRLYHGLGEHEEGEINDSLFERKLPHVITREERNKDQTTFFVTPVKF